MSRIPIPALHHPHTPTKSSTSHSSNLRAPVAFPTDRALSPTPGSEHMSSVAGSISEGRKKQSKRDEAIRKKIEAELGRKRTISVAHSSGRKRAGGKAAVAKGSVAALKPSPALTVPENITVAEASQLCAAKRTDCVLVVDDEEGLSGIFTAKDLAYRVTAEGLDPHTTPVGQIMTRNPMVTRDTTSATEALQLMVQKHFRHLPVCNEDGNVVGLLDITKVFHEALGKVERSSSASEKLYSALAGVQSELGFGMAANPQAAAMLAYVDALRTKTALPDLTTVMDSRTQAATVTPKTTVKEVAVIMRERRTTAVCVMEPAQAPGMPPRIAGIFTSKDVVLRVIAAGLDSSICSVVRVMTPHPDIAPPTMTIHDALKKMHNGHYLNLPVVEADGRLVAIVDVLKLTYATLEQMNQMAAEQAPEANAEAQGGPMWGRFFDSLGDHDDTESVMSGSHALSNPSTPAFQRHLSRVQQSPQDEVHPNDSASVVDDDASDLLPVKKGGKATTVMTDNAPEIPKDDGTYVFKFRTPSGMTHRFQARHDNVETLRDIVAGKLEKDIFFTLSQAEKRPDHRDFVLSYTDADGDNVVITSDHDVTDAVKIARGSGADRVVLIIQGPKEWSDTGVDKTEVKAEEIPVVAKEEVKEVVTTEVRLPEGVAMSTPSDPHAHVVPENVMGIPKDMLLPASIGALAVVIIGIFTISRLTRDY